MNNKFTNTTMDRDNEADQVLEILKKYAYQSQSYNILRKDKSYFFSPSKIDGVIAFVVNLKVALVAGDPVCDPNNLYDFILEFKQFCHLKKWKCCFQAVTDRCKNILEKLDFEFIKIGEEPIFDLEKLLWQGKKFKNLRNDIRSAQKNGLIVVEYCPLIKRMPDWEINMEELSSIWKKFKGSGEFSFLIGEPSLDNPGERKYFLLLNDKQVEAFVVCTPIYARNGIYFDLIRRKEKTQRGTNQLLITETFRFLKEQGYSMGTLGTSPLSNKHVLDENQNYIIKMSLKLTYNHLGYFHRFKPLYKFKKQFGPTSWESRYFAFYPKKFNPIIIYALLKAYDPSGVTGKVLRKISLVWRDIKNIKKIKKNLIGKIKIQKNLIKKIKLK